MKPPVKNLKLELYPTGDVTQWFGENPVLYGKLGLAGHNGIDIVRPWGEAMYAIEDATVVEVKNDPGGFGKHVRIISNVTVNGYRNEWTYGHCSAIHVSVNDEVKAGQHIADMGNTGFVVSGSTPYWKNNPYAGTHLHLGLRKVKPSPKGWSYPGSTMRIVVADYDNGYKGGIDPLPLLSTITIEETELPDDTEVQRLLTIRSLLNQVLILTQKLVALRGK